MSDDKLVLTLVARTSVPANINGRITSYPESVRFGAPLEIKCTVEVEEGDIDLHLPADSDFRMEILGKEETENLTRMYINLVSEKTVLSVGQSTIRVNIISEDIGAEIAGLDPYLGFVVNVLPPELIVDGILWDGNPIDPAEHTYIFLSEVHELSAIFTYPGPNKTKFTITPVLSVGGNKLDMGAKSRILNLKPDHSVSARWTVETVGYMDSDCTMELHIEGAGTEKYMELFPIYVSSAHLFAVREWSLNNDGCLDITGFARDNCTLLVMGLSDDKGEKLLETRIEKGHFNGMFNLEPTDMPRLTLCATQEPANILDAGKKGHKEFYKVVGRSQSDAISLIEEVEVSEGHMEQQIHAGCERSVYRPGETAVIKVASSGVFKGKLELLEQGASAPAATFEMKSETSSFNYKLQDNAGITAYDLVVSGTIDNENVNQRFPSIFWSDLPLSVEFIGHCPPKSRNPFLLPGEKIVKKVALEKHDVYFTDFGDLFIYHRINESLLTDSNSQTTGWVAYEYMFDHRAWSDYLVNKTDYIAWLLGPGKYRKSKNLRQLHALQDMCSKTVLSTHNQDTSPFMDMLDSWFKSALRSLDKGIVSKVKLPDTKAILAGIKISNDFTTVFALNMYLDYLLLEAMIHEFAQLGKDVKDITPLKDRIRQAYSHVQKSWKETIRALFSVSAVMHSALSAACANSRVRILNQFLSHRVSVITQPGTTGFKRGSIVPVSVRFRGNRGKLTPPKVARDVKLELKVALPEPGWYLIYPITAEGMLEHSFQDISLNVSNLEFRFASPTMPKYTKGNILLYLTPSGDLRSSSTPAKLTGRLDTSTQVPVLPSRDLESAANRAVEVILTLLIKLENKVELSPNDRTVWKKVSYKGSLCAEKAAKYYSVDVNDILMIANRSGAFSVTLTKGRPSLFSSKQEMHILSLSNPDKLSKSLKNVDTLTTYLSIARTPQTRFVAMNFVVEALSSDAIMFASTRPKELRPIIKKIEDEDLFELLDEERGINPMAVQERDRASRIVHASLPAGKWLELDGTKITDVKGLVEALYSMPAHTIYQAVLRGNIQDFFSSLRAKNIIREVNAVKEAALAMSAQAAWVKEQLISRMEMIFRDHLNFLDILTPHVDTLLFGDENISCAAYERLREANDSNTGMLILDRIFRSESTNRIRAILLMKEMGFQAAIPTLYKIAMTTRIPEEEKAVAEALVELKAPLDVIKDIHNRLAGDNMMTESVAILDMYLKKV